MVQIRETSRMLMVGVAPGTRLWNIALKWFMYCRQLTIVLSKAGVSDGLREHHLLVIFSKNSCVSANESLICCKVILRQLMVYRWRCTDMVNHQLLWSWWWRWLQWGWRSRSSLEFTISQFHQKNSLNCYVTPLTGYWNQVDFYLFIEKSLFVLRNGKWTVVIFMYEESLFNHIGLFYVTNILIITEVIWKY